MYTKATGLTNETIECKSFGKDEDKNHPHKELGLLRICSAQLCHVSEHVNPIQQASRNGSESSDQLEQ